MIVKDEEAVLDRCLQSIADIVDEIVIVDTGSQDRTQEIARKYTDLVFDFEWVDDFSEARNESFRHASMDYVLWLDADDVVSDVDRIKLAEFKKNLSSDVDAVTMWYHLAFQGDQPTVSSRLVRLVKRSRGFVWRGRVHEYLEINGNILNSDIAIIHRPVEHDAARNLRIYEKKLALGEDFSPRDMLYYANELLDHAQYEKAVQWYKRFLATGQCWKEDAITACFKLAECFRAMNQPEQSKQAVLHSFLYDTPRAEACCRIGHAYLEEGKIDQAIFWYDLATKCRRPANFVGFVNHACETWLPHIQLCVCYSRLGQYRKAYDHNERAAEYLGEDPMIVHNRSVLRAWMDGELEKP